MTDGKARAILTTESCFVCGETMTVYTTIPQECPCGQPEGCSSHDKAWWAYDGDTVRCEECGALGWVSVDDDEAHVNYDEMSKHNMACWETYEATRKHPQEMGD